MKVLVDEHIPRLTVEALRVLGHDVRDIRGTVDEGLSDTLLWAMAQREGRLLITADKGFTRYRADPHHGLLVIRLRQPNRDRLHERVLQALQQRAESDWPGLLVVMRDVAQSVWRAPEMRP